MDGRTRERFITTTSPRANRKIANGRSIPKHVQSVQGRRDISGWKVWVGLNYFVRRSSMKFSLVLARLDFLKDFIFNPQAPSRSLPPSVLVVAILLNLHTLTHGSLLTSTECLVFVILGAELGGQRRAYIPGASWVYHRKLVRVDNQKEMARRLPHLSARRPAVALSAHGADGLSPGMVFIPVIQPLSESAWATACSPLQ